MGPVSVRRMNGKESCGFGDTQGAELVGTQGGAVTKVHFCLQGVEKADLLPHSLVTPLYHRKIYIPYVCMYVHIELSRMEKADKGQTCPGGAQGQAWDTAWGKGDSS